MNIDIRFLIKLIKSILILANKTLDNLGETGVHEIHNNKTFDISTEGDVKVAKALITHLKLHQIPAIVYCEESGKHVLSKNPIYTIALDDIDGTDNYYRGRSILPYCTVITIFNSIHPKFRDALIAGIIEHNSGDIWHAIRDGGCYLNDIKTRTSRVENLNRRTSIIIDHYASHECISRMLKVYSTSWVKDFGSAAFHFAGVGNGMFDAYLNFEQKFHELGAGYLIARESGGFIKTLDGSAIDTMAYHFDKTLPIVVASSAKLGAAIISKIKNARSS
jgi:fructose-1,6-bisphosphatase/inositol monophosphatase family enzyme